MILIADSGTTKTDWILLNERGEVEQMIASQGINPWHMTPEEIGKILANELVPKLGKNRVGRIEFYGSGCTPSAVPIVEGQLKTCFPETYTINVFSDLLGAARAVCGKEEGLVSILGTGSNSCLYDGSKIIRNIPPLGYVLGDEGSGAVLGKLFFNSLLRGMLPLDLTNKYFEETGLNMEEILNKVYRKPQPSRFLASAAPFIKANISDDYLKEMVIKNFRAHMRSNLTLYARPDLPIGAVGSIAWNFADQLQDAAKAEGLRVGRIIKSPIEGLANFYSKPSK